MSDLRELYQSVILDHNKRPRNFREPEGANRSARGDNPLCGDKLIVFLEVDGESVKDAAFLGSGCAISTASASLMTEAIKGKSTAEAEKLFGGFHALVTSDPTAPAETRGLGKLEVFAGVREFPVRVKCATLAWHTMHAALAGGAQAVSTE
ncbi:MAG: SUF system NifU family Fe-S cluster assembly protein [Myxococcales bacterium]|nr:SUF system NifU family Fe-S cluster assembly protein [Myxococcales bacterium]